MVHQHFTFVPAMTVAENVALAGGARHGAARERVRVIAEETGLVLDPDARAGELPVGAQQRLEIVKALARSARVLILDEPTAVLAPAEVAALAAVLRRFAANGGAVVVITHKLREALEVADDVTVLRRGRTVLTGAARALSGGNQQKLVLARELDGAPEALVAEAASALGDVRCLVNNVGVAYQSRFDELTDSQWDEMWQLNVMSYVRAIRAVLPAMRDGRGGVIVNVSSTAGKRPSTGMPNYSVTKAAVLSLSRLVADLYARDGVRCNAVAPGPTATDAWLGEGGLAEQQAAASGKTKEEVLEAVGKGRPLGRLAEPEEIAAVVAFLCSERARYVTGAAWSADGGTVPIIV
jgi:NAD(P)-dependent dehydrogenase (short-subunit alcohol dehydrogenase family)